MVRATTTQIAELCACSVQYARRRVKQLGMAKGSDGKYDFEEYQRLTKGDAKPDGAISGKHEPSAGADQSPREPQRLTKREIDGLSKIDLEKLLIIERTEKQRLDNAVRRRTLVKAEDVQVAQVRVAETVRDEILNSAAKCAANIAAELGVDERAAFAALDRFNRSFLERVSAILSSQAESK